EVIFRSLDALGGVNGIFGQCFVGHVASPFCRSAWLVCHNHRVSADPLAECVPKTRILSGTENLTSTVHSPPAVINEGTRRFSDRSRLTEPASKKQGVPANGSGIPTVPGSIKRAGEGSRTLDSHVG